MSELERAFQGPRRGADRAVLLAHGAGSDMNSPALRAVADRLEEHEVPSLRFNHRYRSEGRKAPDRAAVLEATTRHAVERLADGSGLEPSRLVLGGRSMGGRYCSMLAGAESEPTPTLGLALLGYPLHPAGRPERIRADHFPRITSPVLFVSGTRDALAPVDALEREAKALPGSVTFHWLESADHGFRPLKSSGLTHEEVLADAADATTKWVLDLPG